MSEEKVLKGQCGICGINLYADEDRYRRNAGEPYLCPECYADMKAKKCGTCTDLFHCDLDHNDTDCKE